MLKIPPGLATLLNYRLSWLAGDLAAGLSVAAIALPIGIAYAAIMDLPPQMGLFAAILPAVLYALIAPSARVQVGPDAATCSVAAATLLSFALPVDMRVGAAAMLAILVGVFLLLGSYLRASFLADLLSKPILAGYIAGIAIELTGEQIGRITAIPMDGPGMRGAVISLLQHLRDIHWASVLCGAVTLLALRLSRRFLRRLPGSFIAVMTGIAVEAAFRISDLGIAVLGPVTGGFPMPVAPPANLDWPRFVLGALAVSFVAFASGLISARTGARLTGETVQTEAEMRSLGLANIMAGFSGAFPVTGATTRTVVAVIAGSRTAVTSMVSATVIAIVTLFFMQPLALLPMPVLGAVLASAALDMLDLRMIWKLRRVARFEMWLAIGTAIMVVLVGALQAVAVALAATLVQLLRELARPNDALLGRVPGQVVLAKLHRNPNAAHIPGVLVYLFEASPLFLNAGYLRQRALTCLMRHPDTRAFVLDASVMTSLDSTAIEQIEALKTECDQRKVRLIVAGGNGNFLRVLEQSGLAAKLRAENLFANPEEAVAALSP